MDLIKNDIKKINIALRKKNGFQLCISVFNNPVIRKEIINKFDNIEIINIEDNILNFENNLKNLAKKSKAIHVIGLENSKNKNLLIKNLNLNRDYIAKIAEVNLVFWILESHLPKFITNAPDLFHWSSGIFNFISKTNNIENPKIPMHKKINIENIAINPIKDLPHNFLGNFNLQEIWINLKKINIKNLEPLVNFLIKKLYQNINIENQYFNKIENLKYLKYSTITIKVLESSKNKDLFNIIKLYQILSLSYKYLGYFKNAKSYIKQSIDIIEDNQPIDNYQLSKSYNILSQILLSSNEIKLSKKYQKKAIYLIKNYSDCNYYLDKYYYELAIIYEKLENLEKEKFYMKKSLAIYTHMKNNPKGLSSVFRNLAIIYNKLGDLKNAKFYIEKSINIENGDHFNKIKDLEYLSGIKKIIDKNIEDSLIKT